VAVALGEEGDIDERKKAKGKRQKGQGRWAKAAASREARVAASITLGLRAAWRETLLILALDTTTRGGSVAILRDGDIAACVTGDPAITHGERLPGDFARVLGLAGAHLADLDLLAVAAGPGSFTGLRVGIAAVQGLAFARGLRVAPISALDALARATAEAGSSGALIAPWIDAQRGEVFAALYEADGRTVLAAPSSLPPLATLRAWDERRDDRPLVCSGDGAVRYARIIEETLSHRAEIRQPVPPLAPTIARMAARDPDRAVLPHAVVPLYVRRPDAELARDRRRMS